MADYVIAYDIRSPRRLARVHRYLKKVGVAIQYSVFYVVMDERKLNACLAEAATLIDPRQDDLRCYPLPSRGLRARLGKATLPEGIQWTGLPSEWMGDISATPDQNHQPPAEPIDSADKNE